jgi:hypothetical protein
LGVTKVGKMHALRHELYMIAGVTDALPQQVMSESAMNNLMLYTTRTPHWEQISYAYKSNTPAIGCVRSCTQLALVASTLLRNGDTTAGTATVPASIPVATLALMKSWRVNLGMLLCFPQRSLAGCSAQCKPSQAAPRAVWHDIPCP